MNESMESGMLSALKTSFIDRRYLGSNEYKARIIDNRKDGIILSEEIKDNLKKCSSFIFSVAFINQSGLEVILQSLKEAVEEGKRGCILTTDYLSFSEPKALERLLSFSPYIKVKVITEEAFHTKGYYFKNPDNTSVIIIGSSNLTQGALKSNHEWNVRLSTSENGEYHDEFERAFFSLWQKAMFLNTSWLDEYKEKYRNLASQIIRLKRSTYYQMAQLKPNKMQSIATEALKKLRAEGHDKALIVAATGTGKTLLSCFDVKEYNPHRLLFVVHREQILKDAANSFEQVIGKDVKREKGFLTGREKNWDKKYVFATINSLYKEVKNKSFPPSFFDYIIIDEVHKAGAGMYQEILSYLRQSFLLGMSATPDRNDGKNIYSLFDYTLACDIRLKEALESDLLCPFHYFGIADITVDGKMLSEESSFNDLVREERAKNILEKSEFYGYSGERVKGLIFCSRIEEAKELSLSLNKLGAKTKAVSGETKIEERIEYTERLLQDKRDGEELDYILSVDVFNEGVDLPGVNQVIMLRPTESSIIFIQQLGRGLRKKEGKEFLVVIDFIANYKKNYLIPVALSSDSSYNKDNLRRDSFESSKIIPGCSTVNFDKIARKLIYKKIDEANFSSMQFLLKEYQELKNKIGRIPTIKDFREDNSIDIQRYVDAKGSYYAFLKEKEKDFKIRLSDDEERMIFYISSSFSEGKRRGELDVLKELLDMAKENVLDSSYKLKTAINESVKGSLTLSFVKDSERIGRFRNCEILDENLFITPLFLNALKHSDFLFILSDIIDDALIRNEKKYSFLYKDTDLVLYEKYTYEDVCRLLRWKKNETAQNIGGYKYDSFTKTLPVFINYEKDDNAIKYEDRFISEDKIIALSKKPRKTDSKDADHIYKRREEDKENRIFLFVRKNKDADLKKEFYFLGEINAEGEPEKVEVDTKDAFEIQYALSDPVRKDIYEYLIAELD